jgi:hypothetical protein
VLFSNQEKDKFYEQHAKNAMQVYPVWQATKDFTKPTKVWKGLLKADQKAVKPYVMTELMGEGDSVHNICQLANKKKTLKTGKLHLVELWISLFDKAFNNKSGEYNKPEAPKLRNFATRLRKTKLKEMFDEYVWKGSSLISRQDMIALTAARTFIGDVWNKGKAEFELAKQAVEDMAVDEDEGEEEEEEENTTPKKVGLKNTPQQKTPKKRNQ